MITRILLILLSFAFILPSFAEPPVKTDIKWPQEAIPLIETSDIALAAFLRSVSHYSSTPLKSLRSSGDYRLTIFAEGVNVEQVMRNTAYLLNHGEADGFAWEEVNQPAQEFLLRRSIASVRREERMRNELGKTAAVWLSEYKDSFTLAGDARKKKDGKALSAFLSGDNPTPPEGLQETALSLLTDAEFQILLKDGSFRLPIARIPPVSRDQIMRAFQGKAEIPSEFEVRFTVSKNVPGSYDMTGNTLPEPMNRTLTTVIDPLGVMGDTGKTSVKTLSEKEDSPEIDLTKTQDKKPAADDLSARLRAIARAAHINVYCEYFPPRLKFFLGGALNDRGKLNTLLNQTAEAFSYNIVRRGDSYFLWSRTWFLDRPNTLPDKQYTAWRTIFENDQPFTLDQRIEMTQLTDGQIGLLARTPLRFGEPDVSWLRFVASLTAEQRQIAAQEEGIAISLLTESQRRLLPYRKDTTALKMLLRNVTDESMRPKIEITLINDKKEFVAGTAILLRPLSSR